MKGLILSFFTVLLAYSLIFDEKEVTTTEPVFQDSNSVYVIQPAKGSLNDSISRAVPHIMISYTDLLKTGNIL